MQVELLKVDIILWYLKLIEYSHCLCGLLLCVVLYRLASSSVIRNEDIGQNSKGPGSLPYIKVVLERGQHLNEFDLSQSPQLMLVQEVDQQILLKTSIGGVNCSVYFISICNSVVVDIL